MAAWVLPAISLAISTGMGVAGMAQSQGQAAANAKQAKAQREYLRELNKLKLNDAKALDAYMRDEFEITRQNFENNKAYIERVRTQEWHQQNRINKQNYRNSVKAYNESVRSYKETLEFNNISASLAARDADRVQKDRVTDINFRAAEEEMNYLSNLRKLGEQVSSANLDYQRAFSTATLAKEKLVQDLQQKKQQSDLQRAELSIKEAQAEATSENQIAAVKLQVGAAADQYATQLAEVSLLSDKNKAETANQLQKQRYDAVMEEGKIRGKGTAGVGAMKALQAAEANNAMAQSMIVDTLIKNERGNDIARRRLADTLRNTRKQGLQNMTDINTQLMQTKQMIDVQELGLSIQDAQLAAQVGLSIKGYNQDIALANQAKQLTLSSLRGKSDDVNAGFQLTLDALKASRKSAKGQYDSDLNRISLDKYAADIAAANNLLPKPSKPPKLPKPIMPPDPIMQEPRSTDFDAIERLNKKHEDAVPEPYSPGGLAMLQHGLGVAQTAVQGYQNISEIINKLNFRTPAPETAGGAGSALAAGAAYTSTPDIGP